MTQRKPLHLSDIPFSATLPTEPCLPALSDLVSDDAATAGYARRRWLQYPLQGTINTLAHMLLTAMPSNCVSAFGARLSGFARVRYRNRIFAKRIERNLRALTPNQAKDASEQTESLHRWWQNIGRTMAEFSKANHLWRHGRIKVKGSQNLDEARELGGPLIFVSMHLGTWEAAFTAIHEGLAGPSIGPFQPEPNPFTNRIVHRLRKKRNQYLFPPGQRSAIRLHKLMCAGKTSLTIFIDEVRDKQIHMPVFGRPLPDKGNAIVAIKLANACGGTIIPFYLERKVGPDFDLNFLPPIQPQTGPGTRYVRKTTLTALNDIFEPVVLRDIEHWYMLPELRLPEGYEDDPALQDHIARQRARAE